MTVRRKVEVRREEILAATVEQVEARGMAAHGMLLLSQTLLHGYALGCDMVCDPGADGAGGQKSQGTCRTGA